MSLWYKQVVEGMIWLLDFLQVMALCHTLLKHFAYQILVSEVKWEQWICQDGYAFCGLKYITNMLCEKAWYKNYFTSQSFSILCCKYPNLKVGCLVGYLVGTDLVRCMWKMFGLTTLRRLWYIPSLWNAIIFGTFSWWSYLITAFWFMAMP